MIRGIFFDLFGTLLVYGNMDKAWADWLHHFHAGLKAHGLTLSKAEFSKECDQFFSKDEPLLPIGNLTVFESRIKALCSMFSIDIDDKIIGFIADEIAGKWQEQISLDPEALPVLRELKQTKTLALISNFDHPRHVRKCLSEHGLADLFESVVISGDAGVRKPDPTIFAPALTETGLVPNEVAYVGDTEEDMQAAKAAKMTAILISRQDEPVGGKHLDFEHERQCNSDVGGVSAEIVDKTIATLRELTSV